ncbi:hypothetical protein [Oscillatoria acuminata]|nr:hypothetical protein [Oscillatoria acuminata]
MVYVPLENNLSVVAQQFTGLPSLNFITARVTYSCDRPLETR